MPAQEQPTRTAFVTAAGLARLCLMEPRTFWSRLKAAKSEPTPDAFLVEGGELQPLFFAGRAADLKSTVNAPRPNALVRVLPDGTGEFVTPDATIRVTGTAQAL